MSGLSHLDREGRARMVDVGGKAETVREARATGLLRCDRATLDLARRGELPKGAVEQTAELAGVMAAKRAAELVPMCHLLLLAAIEVAVAADPDLPGYRISATVRSKGQTGVEIEALTAVSIACVTLFDMLKAVDRSMVIEAVRVIHKSGGQSDAWPRTDG